MGDGVRDADKPAAVGDIATLAVAPGLLIPPSMPERVNPADFSISLRSHRAAGSQGVGGRRQSMRGFEDAYTDIVDYLIRITARIWDEQDVGYLHRCYAEDIRVVTDEGVRTGRDTIIEGTLQHLAAFPDSRVDADEIIWAGDDEVGFHTSHRNVSVGHHTGPGWLGRPTGRKSVAWGIANCVSLENYIFQEWELFDTLTFYRQLGIDGAAIARAAGAGLPVDDLERRFAAASEWWHGGLKPQHMGPVPDDFDVNDFITRTGHYTWNWRNLSVIDAAYAPTVRWHGPSGRAFCGRGELKAFVLSLLATFPDLAYHVDDIYYMGNEREGYRVSTRWSIVGTHRGAGVYGEPTHRRVHIWGISQQRIEQRRITEEWTLFNEYEILKQLAPDAPAVP